MSVRNFFAILFMQTFQRFAAGINESVPHSDIDGNGKSSILVFWVRGGCVVHVVGPKDGF